MEVDRKLNIVFKVFRENGQPLYVHSTPIRRETFEAHFLVLSRMMSEMYEQKIAPYMMPRIGFLMLRNVAEQMGKTVEIEATLLPEIWRLTNVLVPRETGGWEMLPFDKALADKLIDDDDAMNLRNNLVFFTAASWVHTSKERTDLIYPLFVALGSQTGSWQPMAFTTTLPTSTQAASSGATAKPASIPA